MKMTDKIKKQLEDAGIDSATIIALSADEGNAESIAKLTADLEAANGKAGGILEDKKKFQKQVDELEQKLSALTEKDLGEVERLKLELEREKSKSEKASADLTEANDGYAKEKRNSFVSKIGSGLKWLDTVPADTRDMIIRQELSDIDDLGNQVLVDAKLKSVFEKYAGMIAADAPSGSGSKSGSTSGGSANAPAVEKVLGMTDVEILADPAAALQAANDAQTE